MVVRADDLPEYEILDEVGSGSFGVVLKARQRRLDRFVAIKQLPAVLGHDPEVRRRFVTEAKVLSSIDHPHVVPVFDFVDRGDVCLLIMELLTGGSLSERRAREVLTLADLLAIGLAACSGLEAAHGRGVLHRDIKPANLLFASTGALKIVDFGIAKMIGGSASLATVAGTVLGSAAFMAPEQVLGDPVSPATDVYALASVLYESIAARLPFDGDRSDQLHLLMARVEQDPIALREVADVPEPIATVIMRALDRRPGERPPSAEAFGIELARGAETALGPGWLRDAATTVFASGALLQALGPALRGDRVDADDDQERWAASGVRRLSIGPEPEQAPIDLVVTGIRDLVPVHEVVGAEVATTAIETAPALPANALPWVGGFRARLLVAEPGGGERRVEIDGPTLVGRDADGLPIADLEVSRRHCVLAPSADGVVVTDLRSSNGTFVAGVLVEGRAVARASDEIKVGVTRLTVLGVEPLIRRQLRDALDAVVAGALGMTGGDDAWLVDVAPGGVRVLADVGGGGPDATARTTMTPGLIGDPMLAAHVRGLVVPVTNADATVVVGGARVQVPLRGTVPVSRLSIPCVFGGRVVALLEVGAHGSRGFDDYVPYVAVLAGVAAALLAPDHPPPPTS
jgi:tRNA A-37 threonylcarbamoyl transferase component Bud32